MSALSIATWNINSVRLRIDLVMRFLGEAKPDVLCLQEIKCAEEQFPSAAFVAAGYPHLHVVGQKGYHGVAIASKRPLEPLPAPSHCRHDEARQAVARVGGIELHNYYVPAGGDEPSPETNAKFAHKLDYVAKLGDWAGEQKKRLAAEPVVVVGDLNIAPLEHDVWSHKQLLDVVSHTPAETDGLLAAQKAGGFLDVARAHIPEPEKLYTWWSYRARDWRASNRGRRLDHIWVSPPLKAGALKAGRAGLTIFQACRDWEKPSDHVPVMARITV